MRWGWMKNDCFLALDWITGILLWGENEEVCDVIKLPKAASKSVMASHLDKKKHALLQGPAQRDAP